MAKDWSIDDDGAILVFHLNMTRRALAYMEGCAPGTSITEQRVDADDPTSPYLAFVYGTGRALLLSCLQKSFTVNKTERALALSSIS